MRSVKVGILVFGGARHRPPACVVAARTLHLLGARGGTQLAVSQQSRRGGPLPSPRACPRRSPLRCGPSSGAARTGGWSWSTAPWRFRTKAKSRWAGAPGAAGPGAGQAGAYLFHGGPCPAACIQAPRARARTAAASSARGPSNTLPPHRRRPQRLKFFFTIFNSGDESLRRQADWMRTGLSGGWPWALGTARADPACRIVRRTPLGRWTTSLACPPACRARSRRPQGHVRPHRRRPAPGAVHHPARPQVSPAKGVTKACRGPRAASRSSGCCLDTGPARRAGEGLQRRLLLRPQPHPKCTHPRQGRRLQGHLPPGDQRLGAPRARRRVVAHADRGRGGGRRGRHAAARAAHHGDAQRAR
jgi:hypothetical protein